VPYPVSKTLPQRVVVLWVLVESDTRQPDKMTRAGKYDLTIPLNLKSSSS
jgi:hypothetical protein